ncbi:MAG: site-specific integrase [Thaumarchaeota archaeon]|nr:site-specific integrase [Nitrososphaerota archaeon]
MNQSSPTYANAGIISLSAFFGCNGYKHFRALELERYHVPRRLRVRPEYVPTKGEVYRMADSAGSLRNRALVLTMFSSGFRNSTVRALLVQDVIKEIERGIPNIRLPCYLGMKKVVPNGCKGSIEYYSFTCDEATVALRLYLGERIRKNGEVKGEEPLFASLYNQVPKEERQWKVMSAGELQVVVKGAARKAGLAEWHSVYPHCLRKSYETILHTQLLDGSNMEVKVQEVFMGHVLPRSQDNYFDRSKTEWMRIQYSKLNFGRILITDKFAVLRMAVARAFEGTDLDPEQLILEYAKKYSG